VRRDLRALDQARRADRHVRLHALCAAARSRRRHAELGLSPFQRSPGYLQRSFDATVSATFAASSSSNMIVTFWP
jgi:hypothetical protein